MPEKQRVKEDVKQKTRLRIVEAATQAFASKGYHGVKIAALAREAGVANGTFYLHFKDIDTLYTEVLRLAGQALATKLFAVHSFNINPATADRAEIDAIMDFSEQQRDYMAIIVAAETQPDTQKSDVFEPIVEMRRKELKKGIQEGHISRRINPTIAARAEISMMVATIQWWLNNKSNAPREEVIDTLTQLRRSWVCSSTDSDDIDMLLSQWDSRL